MGCKTMCQKFSVKYLQLANALVLIAGLACLGFGGYVWYTLGKLVTAFSLSPREYLLVSSLERYAPRMEMERFLWLIFLPEKHTWR